MDSFNARTVMAARIARECPAAIRPAGEPVAEAPGPVAGRAPGAGLGLGLGAEALKEAAASGSQRGAWARANGGL